MTYQGIRHPRREGFEFGTGSPQAVGNYDTGRKHARRIQHEASWATGQGRMRHAVMALRKENSNWAVQRRKPGGTKEAVWHFRKSRTAARLLGFGKSERNPNCWLAKEETSRKFSRFGGCVKKEERRFVARRGFYSSQRRKKDGICATQGSRRRRDSSLLSI